MTWCLSIFWLVMIAGFSVQAQQNPLLCNSSESRLLIDPKDCVGVPTIHYDIPTLKLQLEDVKKILQGAESSGGRLVPHAQNRPIGTASLILPTHVCQARLLLDAGHRVSWLLLSEFEIAKNMETLLSVDLWDSGLVLGSNIDGQQYPLDELPQWGLENLSVEVSDSELTICAISSCSTNESKLETKLTYYNQVAKLQFKVSCQEL